jgi:DNA-binding HxlR family transcriptional regulator
MNVIHPKVQYSLTPFGRTLAPIILMMRDWDQESIIKRKQAAREPVTSEI